jgi:hypothetical protein
MEETPIKEEIMKNRMRKLLDKIEENPVITTGVGLVLVTLGGIMALKEANDRTIVGVRSGTWDNGDEIIGVKTKGGVKIFTKQTV